MSAPSPGIYTWEEFEEDIKAFELLQKDTAVSQAADVALPYFRQNYTPLSEAVWRMSVFFAVRRFAERNLAELSAYPTGSPAGSIDTTVFQQVLLHYSAPTPDGDLPDAPNPKDMIWRAMKAE